MNKGLLAIVAVVVTGGAAGVAWKAMTPSVNLQTPIVSTEMHGADSAAPARPANEILIPALSSAAEMGKASFDANCASCHGANATGSDNGPPLVHKIYEPSHHADFSFQSAARNGVRAHHWRFGDMQPVPGVTDKQIEWITKFVRELQRANGIN